MGISGNIPYLDFVKGTEVIGKGGLARVRGVCYNAIQFDEGDKGQKPPL
jgi:hypothetical protein